MGIATGKIKKTTLLLTFLTMIFAYTSSTLVRTRYSFYLAVAAYLGFYLISRSMGHKWRVNKTYMWGFFAVAASAMYVLVGASDRLTTYLSGVIYIFFWVNVFYYLMDNYERKTLMKFAIINTVILMVSVIITIRVLTEYPLAARAMNGLADGITEADVARYEAMGCGGFGFIYGFVVFSMGILSAVKAKALSTKLRVFMLVCYVVVFYMIFLAEFTTALLVSTIILMLTFVMGRKNAAVGYLLVGIMFVVLLLLGNNLLDILHKVAQKLDVSYLQTKIEMIMSSSANGSADSLKRVETYMESINGFLSDPIFGSGKAGGHSQIMDTFSTIGLFAIPYVIMLFSAFKKMGEYIKTTSLIILAFVIIVLATVNPFVDSTITSISFMLTPLYLALCAPKQKKA